MKIISTQGIGPYKYTFHFFLLIFLVAICYSNTLNQDWHFDDYPNIVFDKKLHLENVTLKGLEKIILYDGLGAKRIDRPIPRLTFTFNYYLTGLNTVSYHITNIIIHLITAVFVYLVFVEILLIVKARGDTKLDLLICQDIALMGAVLWSIHPIQTQAVTFIVQRMASMAAMFYMMSFYFYIRARMNNIKKSMMYLNFVLSIFCWGCALLSKENTVLLLLSIMLFEIIFIGLSRKKIIISAVVLFCFFVLSLVFFLLTQRISVANPLSIYNSVVEKFTTSYSDRTFTLWERLLTEPRILLYYLFLIFCPIADFFSMESDISFSRSFFDPITTFTSVLAILLLIVLSLTFKKKYRILSFSILFFFANHLVESTILPLELYFEHRNYLPSMFIYLTVSYYIVELCQFYAKQSKIFMKGLIVIFITCIMIAEGNATYLRNDVWSTEETLCLDNISKAPNNVRPMISLASYYIKKGENDKAIQHLKVAEKIFKDNIVPIQDSWVAMIYHNAASAHYQKANVEKALQLTLKSIEFDEYSWQTHALLGLLSFLEGDIERTITAHINSTLLNPEDPRLFNMLGRAFYAKGEYDVALEALQKGVTLTENPQDATELFLNIAACYIQLGDNLQAKRILYKVQSNQDDIAYLLYKSFLYSGEELALKSLDRVARILLAREMNYCSWIADIKKNNFPGIIYPPIDTMEPILLNQYKTVLDQFKDTIVKKYNEAGDCQAVENETIDEPINMIKLTPVTMLN